MKVLHLLASGGIGGIETLCSNYSKYTKNNNTFLIIWGKDSETYRQIKKSGGKVIQLNASKRRPLQILIKIEKIRRKGGFDIVVIHHEITLCYLYLIFLKKIQKSQIHTIIYSHCNANDMLRTQTSRGLSFRKKVLKAALQATDGIIAISQSVKKSLIEVFGVPQNKIQVIYNGVDLKCYQDLKKNRENNGSRKKDQFTAPVKLVYVGRLIQEKGVQNTLNALANVSTKMQWNFDVIGDGPYRSKLEQLADNLGINEKVHFLGERKDVPNLLKDYDIFIHMPIWEEGFGITIIEAMATGLLCICRAKGGIPEIIEDGKNGILVNSNKMLKNVLEELIPIFNSKKIIMIRNNGTTKALEYSIEMYSNQLDDFLQSMKC